MNNYLLFQAYGNIDNINECKYSLLKYWDIYKSTPPADIAIVIYTDQPQLFDEYVSFSHLIEIRKITTEQIKEWRGKDNFVHRVKIKIIQDFFLTHNGNLLYCDTDTYITQTLTQIFDDIKKGAFYMHEFEGLLGKRSNLIFKKWNKFLSSTPIEYNGKKLVYSKSIEIWNAGVIGINNSYTAILNDVLSLTDILYNKYPKHIAEQFAFDYCLQKEGTILSATDFIVHFWDLKEFRLLLNSFFTKNSNVPTKMIIQKANNFNAAIIQKEKHDFKKLSWIKRSYNILRGNKWSIEKYIPLT